MIVEVRFASPGWYKIFTDTQNGFSFGDSALVVDTGYQSIKLKASAKPILAQATDFLVAFDTSFCIFLVPVIGTTNANYALVAAATSCSNFSLQGTYAVGATLSENNRVILEVNVTSVGGYLMTTSTVNGMTFSAAGNFTATGLQTVSLQGSGTPATPGKDIQVTAGSSNCSFIVNVAVDDTGGGTINSNSVWEFSQDDNFYHGYFDGALTVDTSGSTVLTLVGLTFATQDTAIAISVYMEGSNTVKPGTYKSSTSSFFVFFDSSGNGIYAADKTTGGVELTIVITKYVAATQLVEGTFSGTALNQANQPISITGGKFKAQLNQ